METIVLVITVWVAVGVTVTLAVGLAVGRLRRTVSRADAVQAAFGALLTHGPDDEVAAS